MLLAIGHRYARLWPYCIQTELPTILTLSCSLQLVRLFQGPSASLLVANIADEIYL